MFFSREKNSSQQTKQTTKLNIHQQTHLKSMSKRNTSGVQKRRDLHNLHCAAGNKGRAQRFPRPSEGRNTPKNTTFLPQNEERTNQQEHLILKSLNLSEIQFSPRRDFSSAVNVSKVTSDGTCSRSSNRSINLEIME